MSEYEVFVGDCGGGEMTGISPGQDDVEKIKQGMKMEMKIESKEYKCEKCGRHDPYFRGDCFLYYSSPKICDCGNKMILVNRTTIRNEI